MSTTRVQATIQWCVAVIAPATLVICFTVLAGWALKLPILTSVLPGAPPMMPNTAIGLSLLAGALWLLRHESAARPARAVAMALAGGAALIGALTLLEYVAGWQLGIDRWWFPESLAASSVTFPGRPSPRTALCFVLLGASLMRLASAPEGRYVTIQLLALMAGMIPYVALIGYAYATNTLYELIPTIPMALTTAVALLLLSLGVLAARPTQGFMKTVTSEHSGGRVVRDLLLPFIFLQLLLGWLLLAGATLGLYDVRFGSALIAASTTLIFGGLILWTSRAINRQEHRRLEAEMEVLKNQRLLSHVVTNAPVILFATDQTGRIVLIEGRVANRVSPLGPEALGQRLQTVLGHQPEMLAAFERALGGKGSREVWAYDDEVFEVWFEPTRDTIAEVAGVTGVIAVATDVTERQRAEEALKRQNAQIEALFDTTIEGILLVDEHRRVRGHNRRFLELWNLSEAQVLGADDRDLLATVMPMLCDPQSFRSRVEMLYEEPQAPGRDEVELKDGRVFDRYFATPVSPDGRAYGRAWFFRDVTERKRLEQSLTAQNEQLKELDRLKTDFVNAVSHDLRTPLTSITGFSEFLEDEVAGPLNSEQQGFVREIQKSTSRLEGLVNDLLDFARVQAGTFRLSQAPGDLREVAGEVVGSFAPQASEAGVRLSLEDEVGPVALVFDAPRIQQVLINLISNALKFTPPGGSVTLRIVREGGRARVEVHDTGEGIAAADIPRLFQRFSQLEAGAKKGGTGLGLWISKTIVEAHGGTIGVRSAPGKGSTFCFDLPLEPDSPREVG